MKKGVNICLALILIFLLSISLVSLISAQESGEKELEETVKDVEGLVEVIPLDKNTGGIDEEKLIGAKSKAEQRIDNINKWLDDHVFWLGIIFGMRPEVSWEFIINIALILFILNLLVFVIPNFIGDYKLIISIIGLGITFAIVFFGFTVNIAEFISGLIGKWWFKLIAIVIIFILVSISSFLGKYIKKKRDEVQIELDKQELHSGAEVAKTLKKSIR